MNFRKVILYFVIVITGNVYQANAEALELATNPFNEVVYEAARISGQLVTGIQYPSAPNDSPLLQAQVPPDWRGRTICARVVTVDGLYEASNEYEVPVDWQGGLAELPYPTKEQELLGDRQPDSVAVRVSPTGCNTEIEAVTTAVWGMPGPPPSILVNSFQADAVFAYVGGATVPIRCQPLPLDNKIAFDIRCSLDAVAKTGEVKVELLRIVDGKPAPPDSFMLWLQ